MVSFRRARIHSEPSIPNRGRVPFRMPNLFRADRRQPLPNRVTSEWPVICPQSAACSKSTFQILTNKLRRDVKESEKYAGIDWLRHKVQYQGNSSGRCTPYHSSVLTANS